MGIEQIENIAARDKWEYMDAKGDKIISEIIVGAPMQLSDEKGDWFCLVFIENYTDQIVTVAGVGPVDALMNAMVVVKEFFDSKADSFTERFRVS